MFDWICFILADNEDDYNILDEFEFRPDFITDCGVSCPRVSNALKWPQHYTLIFEDLKCR